MHPPKNLNNTYIVVNTFLWFHCLLGNSSPPKFQMPTSFWSTPFYGHIVCWLTCIPKKIQITPILWYNIPFDGCIATWGTCIHHKNLITLHCGQIYLFMFTLFDGLDNLHPPKNYNDQYIVVKYIFLWSHCLIGNLCQ